MKYELRRETINREETVFRGNMEDCIEWMTEVIHKNGYDFDYLTDLNMNPVWSMKHAAFYLREEVEND